MVRYCAACWTAWVRTMTTDLDEDGGFDALDWQGQPIDCTSCPQRALLASGKCILGRACFNDRYALRIDRFFRWNPAVANRYLGHPYFEVRAIAAKYADLFRLPALFDDADETVRWSAAQRLPPRYLEQLANDTHREVRIRVANRLEPVRLMRMIRDPDYYVRATVARRLPLSLLPQMRFDPDDQVRLEVAKRLQPDALVAMVRDPDAVVRALVATRLPLGMLPAMVADEDCQVRYEVAQRIAPADLGPLLDDEDDIVRETARQRLEPAIANESGKTGDTRSH